MSQGTYSSSRILIGNTEFINYSKINYKNSGKNQVSSLSITLNDPELDAAALLGKEVIFYLNYGTLDNIPFFRGRIKQYQPSDKNVKIIAYDVLSFLGGKNSPVINFTDSSNYDGFTLAQFLHDYISTVINKKEILIGLDMLNETDPPVSLSGYRQKGTTPLKVIQEKIPKNISNLDDIRSYRLVLRDDGIKSNITFVEEQDINSGGILFSFNDGIEKLNYKLRPSPNIITVAVGDNIMQYIHNSLPTGAVGGKIEGEFKYPDEARQQAIIEVLTEENRKEITMNVSKGHYLEIGNVVQVNTPNYPDIIGKHRIVSKTISVGGKGVICSLQLNKTGPTLKDYILS